MKTNIENKSDSAKQKIVPFLWFDDNAEEAVDFYTSCFKNSKTKSANYYDEASAKASGRPEGSVLTVSFELNGQDFIALNGGPVFKFTPAVSFFVTCETEKEMNELWKKLLVNGKVLMKLDVYPFSKKYGWVEDQFGLSWQLNLTGEMQKINPFLMFTGKQTGKTEKAINFYTSLFKKSDIINIFHYGAEQKEAEGKVMHARFSLDGEEFMAMDSGVKHDFTFTPAVSFFVYCDTQKEVDYFWDKFTESGKEGDCGWLEDKYGVSWQIVPAVLFSLLGNPDKAKAKRAMQAMIKMKKLDIKTLEEA